MIHYTRIIWEEVAFIWKVTGKSVAIFMTGTVHGHKLFKCCLVSALRTIIYMCM